jgi:hypothetical protein
MNKIRNYKDLLEEKNRLEILANLHEKHLAESWANLKEEFRPVKSAYGFVKKFIVADKSSPLITLISGVVADRFLRKFIFRKADWVSKLVIPVLFRNYSTHVLGRYLSIMYYKLKRMFSNQPQTENSGTP